MIYFIRVAEANERKEAKKEGKKAQQKKEAEEKKWKDDITEKVLYIS